MPVDAIATFNENAQYESLGFFQRGPLISNMTYLLTYSMSTGIAINGQVYGR